MVQSPRTKRKEIRRENINDKGVICEANTQNMILFSYMLSSMTLKRHTDNLFAMKGHIDNLSLLLKDIRQPLHAISNTAFPGEMSSNQRSIISLVSPESRRLVAYKSKVKCSNSQVTSIIFVRPS